MLHPYPFEICQHGCLIGHCMYPQYCFALVQADSVEGQLGTEDAKLPLNRSNRFR